MENVKRLYRSRNERVIGGVAGGLAEYFGLDPALIRIAFALLFFGVGSGLLLYLVIWIIVPLRPLELPENSCVINTCNK